MITNERIQELIKLVEDWHYQSSDGDTLLELVEIVKQQQTEIECLKNPIQEFSEGDRVSVNEKGALRGFKMGIMGTVTRTRGNIYVGVTLDNWTEFGFTPNELTLEKESK